MTKGASPAPGAPEGLRRSFRAEVVLRAGNDFITATRNEDWSGRDFSYQDLRHLDFTASIIKNCVFTGAAISEARFDQAVLGDIHPGASEPADLRLASDWLRHCLSWSRSDFVET